VAPLLELRRDTDTAAAGGRGGQARLEVSLHPLKLSNTSYQDMLGAAVAAAPFPGGGAAMLPGGSCQAAKMSSLL
jgi:hypothetical protein